MNQNQKTQSPESLQGQYAGFVSRFLAWLVDLLIIVLTVVVIGGITNMLLTFFGLADVALKIEASSSIQGEVLRFISAVWGVTFIAFMYHVIFWTVTSGKSIGKGLLGVRIVPMSGTRLTLLWAIWRYITFIMSVLALCLGVIWILISDNRQGWHDKLARTCVIYDWPAREDDSTVQALQSRWHYIKHTRRRLRDKSKQSEEDQTELSDVN